MAWKPLVALVALVALAACGDTQTTAPIPSQNNDPGPDDGVCVPNKTVYETVTRKMIQDHCNRCHGDQPDFGAPYSLTDYDDMIAGDVGERKIDRLVARMADKTMPPLGGTQMPHFELDTVVGWASCGLVHPDETVGLNVSAPVFEAPDEAPADAEVLELFAPQFEVAPDTLDLYQCFTFEAPFDEDRFLRRIEVAVDESRVLHHIVLLRDVERQAPLEPHRCYGMAANSEYLYAWAPGGGPVQFPDGGLRIEPGDRFVMQIHYNNGAGIEDVRDSSGVLLHHSEPVGTEYGMFAPGPLNFSVPGESQKDVTGHCNIRQDLSILAGMPHMHEIGAAFHQEIIRADGTEESLIDLTGWSFESQFFYDTPAELKEGDRLRTTCVFDNPNDHPVTVGEGTSDEMCFNFMYATPPPVARYCDGGGDDAPFVYERGACFPEGAALEDLEPFEGALQIGESPEFKGGELVDGLWKMVGYEFWTPSETLPIGSLDLEASGLEGAGQLLIEGDEVALDLASRINLQLVEGLGINQDVPTSIAGTVVEGGEDNGLELALSCGGEGTESFLYDTDGESLTLLADRSQGPITILILMAFERVR